jgi:diguanylate cyclase (GGDEF)-like protein
MGYEMKTSGGSTHQNIEILKSGINQYSIYALSAALIIVLLSTIVVSYQMTGTVSLEGMARAQAGNFALRILDLMPFVFAVWGQYTGYLMAREANAIIVRETDDLRAETSEWKMRSLHDATHDSLTGLPNREFFYKKLRDALLVASRENKSLTILFLNMDRFKEINDAFGPKTGDYILQKLTEKMQRIIHGKDILARIGGDEFAFLLWDLPSENIVIAIVKRIQEIMHTPILLADEKVEVSASVGVAVFPDHGSDADVLMQCSSIAMYSAKKLQKAYTFYSPELNQDNPRRIMLMSQLRHAIEDEGLELHYQPKLDLRTGQIIAVEALSRWKHQEYGYISPGEFIPLAERTRLIYPLTRWVIRTAIQQLHRWLDNGPVIGMSINISAYDLLDTDLPDTLSDLLADTDVDPQLLTLEITESSIMGDPKSAMEVLHRLHAMNLQLSVDDFGTGYSSLAYLSRLPVHEIKIDQTFVLGMRDNIHDTSIVKGTIDLGHNLGLEVTAEGVENDATLQMLKAMGCDIAQGNYISPPLLQDDFLEWIKDTSWTINDSVQSTISG